MKKFTFLLLLLAGCANDRYFVGYFGQQPNWPTRPGGFAKIVKGIPIYGLNEYPARPYDVLGYAISSDEVMLADLAKTHHADAAILVLVNRRNPGINVDWSHDTNNGGNVNISRTPFAETHAKALLIQYRQH
jgi:hypothetical protein